jgi:hypothetical protein
MEICGILRTCVTKGLSSGRPFPRLRRRWISVFTTTGGTDSKIITASLKNVVQELLSHVGIFSIQRRKLKIFGQQVKHLRRKN